MPTNRKRTPRSRKAKLNISPSLLQYFKTGFPLDRTLVGYPECLGPIFFQREKLISIWLEHRAAIIADCPGGMPYMCHITGGTADETHS